MSRRLLTPSVLFSNNHLLVIHKPPGWSSMPVKSTPHKSLLDNLVARRMGGGSQKDFLIPLHRIDQPCTGVMMFARTSKAASRVTKVWKQQLVQKTYLCVLERPTRNLFEWQRLEGWMPRGKRKGSVTVFREPPRNDDDDDTRHICLDCNSITDSLVRVKTHMGARHMVRALLASHGHAIAGDVRYGADQPLPDRSVALHAESVTLPESLQLGTLEQTHFSAAPPETWKSYFGNKMPRHDLR